MDSSTLSVVSSPRFVPLQLEGLPIQEAAIAWHRAGFDVHPARSDGVRISSPHNKGAKSEADIRAAFNRVRELPGIRMGVNLPDDVAVILVSPRDRENWKAPINRLQAKYDPEKVLFRCPCHRMAGRHDSYLWLTIPKPIEEAHVWGPEGASVFGSGAFVRVPPAGTAYAGTKASWMPACLPLPVAGRWEIPPCPPLLWEAIIARIDEGTVDQDCGM